MGFAAVARASRESKRKMRAAGARFALSALVGALGQWRAAARAAADEKRNMRRSMARWTQGALEAAMES